MILRFKRALQSIDLDIQHSNYISIYENFEENCKSYQQDFNRGSEHILHEAMQQY